MSNQPIPPDHLRACPDHAVVAPRGADGDARCPVCETEVFARPGAVTDESFTDLDMRWQINPDTMAELLPALADDAGRQDIGPVYVAVAEIPVSEVRNAAGYTEQERWFNVAVAETGTGTREIIKHDKTARKAIEAIQNGEGYLDPVEANPAYLDADPWKGVPEYYADTVEYERVDDATLRIHMDGFPSDNAYSDARSEIGHHAKNSGLSVRTVEAGGRFTTGVVEVSLDG